jgi:hypothetical protein
MRQADILLVLASADLARYLPGKLFDYLAARRRILVFGAPGEAGNLVGSLTTGLLCTPGSGMQLGDCLRKLLAMPAPENVRIDQWLEHHRRDRLAAKAFDIIGSVVSN